METFLSLSDQTVKLLSSKVVDFCIPSIGDKIVLYIVILITEKDEVTELNINCSEPENNVLERKELAADDLFNYMSEMYDNEKENVLAGIYAESEAVAVLQKCTEYMRMINERHNNAVKKLNELKNGYVSVTERTSSLHNACDQMMAHQTHLAAGAEQIRANLYYFIQYDSIMKKLNTGKLLTNGKSFMQLLATIDECLKFLNAHSYYKDANAYIVKYTQCLSKAMTAIRIGVLADLEASVNAVRDRQAQLEVDAGKYQYVEEDTFALIYGVFAGRANSIRSALAVAEQRFADVSEYQAMVSDCQNTYFSIRQQLLSPILNKTIEQLLGKHSKSSCAFARNGCAFLLRLCDDEFRLFKQFFNIHSLAINGREQTGSNGGTPSSPLAKVVFGSFVTTQTSFEDFIEAVCRTFYDVLRPIVVHNPHLETLAELCTILKVEMIEERCGLMMSVMQQTQGGEYSEFNKKANVSSNEADEVLFNPRSGFVHVMGELVGDVAERIVYCAGLYGQTDIAGFRPSPGDLAYPEKLIMMKNIEKEHNLAKACFILFQCYLIFLFVLKLLLPFMSKSDHFNETENASAETAVSAIDLHCLWYPTVRRTVLCLSKLYRCLDPAVFQSIAYELLKLCCESLERAAEGIRSDVAKKTTKLRASLDAELFVVKHLLILREQTGPYRITLTSENGVASGLISQRDYSLDFSKYKTSASNLFQNRQRWFELNSNNAFFELLFQVPVSMSESSGDSRRTIDVQLKSHCHALIKIAADLIVMEFNKYIEKVEKSIPSSSTSKEDDKPLVEATLMQDLSAQAFGKLSKQWPEIKDAFSLYIGAKDAEDVLLQAVRKQIIDVFVRANEYVKKFYDVEQRQIASVPAQEQVAVMLN
uniref:Conserved oligomeric Golgi complex subunit 3 n=1 Tax=Syphacia muris TaxID=451379 RepID=A0A158R597_9BILA